MGKSQAVESGGREEGRDAYEQFLVELIDQRNAIRSQRLNEELDCIGRLPLRRLEHTPGFR